MGKELRNELENFKIQHGLKIHLENDKRVSSLFQTRCGILHKRFGESCTQIQNPSETWGFASKFAEECLIVEAWEALVACDGGSFDR
ncbi:hypothetical protein NC653_012701 [Populus alba x Populus x berolinensis]|uniref:Uncharacterized protein n=1 Tax=Populus alba x Populus x berolinensis TaxID=444605 RepID=A0AAD6QSZ5_9ROSI|nr:hypothetical protein NC653_012701 [Populus alba x Populus x berolinensis]